ncbi:hypothetical protein GCM10011391_13700 [Pullulanibacillus camelliae]|uniref:Flagellar protein n=1 Tax=Pullulanibacillus camelliae TaxID=1707096 RepID=A0A8J2VPN9_9BACL|nr:TIGR03826 family flagellar region protein [Pullulanibacillus camelliae]GGE36160.1 hypothetical protein GCM10011391_13700 [Pullulanibacillus camelliae]
MAELANCKNCGKLFVRTTSDICPACHKEDEKKFQKVYKFISKRENREATVQELHDTTGVEEKLIFRWIEEGRLLVKNFPNLFYPCSSCGEPIQSGRLCENCASKIKRDLETYEADASKNQDDHDHYKTYKLDR